MISLCYKKAAPTHPSGMMDRVREIDLLENRHATGKPINDIVPIGLKNKVGITVDHGIDFTSRPTLDLEKKLGLEIGEVDLRVQFEKNDAHLRRDLHCPAPAPDWLRVAFGPGRQGAVKTRADGPRKASPAKRVDEDGDTIMIVPHKKRTDDTFHAVCV